MTKPRFSSLLLLAGALAGEAQAQPFRVFVSARTGSNANACDTVAAPCQTLQGAVDKVAPGGVVLVLETGGYGPVAIYKAVTIEVPPGVEAFIHPPSGPAIKIVTNHTDVVVLRGLTLSGGDDYGIDCMISGTVHVERCLIQGFKTGVMFSRGFASWEMSLYLEDTVIRGCSEDGISLLAGFGSVWALIDGGTLEGNGLYGIEAAADVCVSCSTLAVLKNTNVSGNGVGVAAWSFADGRIVDVTADGCTISNNDGSGLYVGASAPGLATLRFANSTITKNAVRLSKGAGVEQTSMGVARSRNDNTIEGNFVNLFGTIGAIKPR
jgi:hypothetical protein